MIRKIYSKLEPNRLLHIAVYPTQNSKIWPDGRQDLCPAEAFLQVAQLCLCDNQTFRPHKHIEQERVYPAYIPQEAWIVIQGLVHVWYYDLDGALLDELELYAGDVTITLAGGHNYATRRRDTLVYEVKSGPYLGQARDKEFLDGRP